MTRPACNVWRSVRFLEDRSAYELTFDKRKDAQFREGNKVMVVSAPLAVICLVRLMMVLLEGSHLRIGGLVCLTRLYRPTGV